MATMEKTMLAMVMVVLGMALVTQVVQAMQPAAPTFCCPLCTDVCFYTYDELYAHFTAAHPSEPIDILWE